MHKTIAIIFIAALFSGAKTLGQTNEHGADTVGHPETPSISKQQKSVAAQQLIKIKVDDLPQGIVKGLQSHGYTDWIIQDAYKNIALKQYSIRLKRGSEVVFYTFDANGDRIKE
jgi:hypothetical protein